MDYQGHESAFDPGSGMKSNHMADVSTSPTTTHPLASTVSPVECNSDQAGEFTEGNTKVVPSLSTPSPHPPSPKTTLSSSSSSYARLYAAGNDKPDKKSAYSSLYADGSDKQQDKKQEGVLSRILGQVPRLGELTASACSY